MKKALYLLIISLALVSCKQHNVWTKDYEQKAYDESYAATANMMPDTAKRREFCLYMISKLKVALPYGIESVSSDSAQKVSAKIGEEYVRTHNSSTLRLTVPWGPYTEASFKRSLLQNTALLHVSPAAKDKLCDCLLIQLKKIFPDSIRLPVPDTLYAKAVNNCRYILK